MIAGEVARDWPTEPVVFSRRARRRLLSPQLAGVALLAVIALVCAAAPLLTPHDPNKTDATQLEVRPGLHGHPLGTDALGRDVLARVLYGGRVSLTVGLAAGAIALAIGLAVGSLSGFGPPLVGGILMRFADLMLALPLMVLLLGLQSVAADGVLTVILVVGLVTWVSIARIVRAQFLSLREREFVVAAQAIGASGARTAVRHILPSALTPVLAVTAFEVAGAILAESTLSYLGLGVPPSIPTWGNILSNGQQYLVLGQWWTVAFPVAAIVTTVTAVNLICSSVRATS
jgi:peptide/nickel transport system permease protein